MAVVGTAVAKAAVLPYNLTSISLAFERRRIGSHKIGKKFNKFNYLY